MKDSTAAQPDGTDTLVIIPTFNERENLPRIVPAVLAVLPRAHVLVVDDLSPDGTGELADELAAADSRVHISHRKGPRGLGPAYLHGFAWALERDYRFVFEMDADFSHQPRYLPDFLRAADRADLVLGCRYMEGGGVEGWAPHRLAISRLGNLYARAILGLSQRDLTGGFKCFRREVLEAMDFDAVQCTGYGFQIELSWTAHNLGFQIAEVPIVFPDRELGSSKMSLTICREAVIGVWKMRLG